MTAFNEASKSLFLAATTKLTETVPVLPSGEFLDARRAALPSPKGAAANVVDNGRIRFGAGFRLPASK